ncbi:hypothetical protein QTP88_020166 [Uroleucon formosanum]
MSRRCKTEQISSANYYCIPSRARHSGLGLATVSGGSVCVGQMSTVHLNVIEFRPNSCAQIDRFYVLSSISQAMRFNSSKTDNCFTVFHDRRTYYTKMESVDRFGLSRQCSLIKV